MAKSDMTNISAAAEKTHMERETAVPHQERVLPPPPVELALEEGPDVADASTEDPVEFILHRVDCIEQWRATVVRLNATQLGVSLVRGVLRRGRFATPPLRPFETTETRALAGGAVEAREEAHVHCPALSELPSLRTCTAYDPGQSATPILGQNDSGAASRQAVYPHHDSVCSTHTISQPSVARRTLVQSVSRASVPLYMGILSALVAHGVTSLYDEDSRTDSQSASEAAAARPVKAAVSTLSTAERDFQAPEGYLHLSTDMNRALHEIHRAAAEVICTIDHESQEMQTLASACLMSEEDSMRDLQLDVCRSCRRLSLIAANLYSLVAFLSFFAVEEAVLPVKALGTAVRTAASVATASHLSDEAAARATHEAEAACSAGNDCHPRCPPIHSLSTFPSVSAVATATTDHDAHAIASTGGTGKWVPFASVTCPAHHMLEAIAAVPPYTVERFHELFDASGQLPQTVWRVFSTTATTLSQFAVSWSLTTGDAQSHQTFNNTARAVLGEDQRCLLLQLHRLCSRFVVLRHRVYALHPVNPLYFKVKQMLEWGGLLNASVPDEWSYDNGDIDRCDLHSDSLHNTYPLGHHLRVSASNRAALRAVMTCPHAATAGDSAHRRVQGKSAFVPSGHGVGGGWRGSTPGDGRASAPLSLLASLVSAGTNGRASASLASLLTGSSADPSPGPSGAASLQHSSVPGYVGLRNTGNTCFLNSVVQLLGSASLFRDDLMLRVQSAVFDHSASTDHQPPEDTRATATEIMADLFTKYGCRLAIALLLGELQWRGAHHHQGPAVVPDYLTPHLPPPFDDHHQHDASEFWHALLDQLDLPSQPGGAVVAKWFSGRTTTTMKCVSCQRKRLHTNTFWDISTPLLRSASASSAPVPLGGGPSSPAAVSTKPGAAATTSTGPVVKQVDVERFANATAVTTTYMDPSAPEELISTSTAAYASVEQEAVTDAEEDPRMWIDGQTILSTPPTDAGRQVTLSSVALPSPSRVEAHEAPKTLQHLLLHVLHPILNKELLHGSNALDCEHCHRRTDTVLTTRLVANVGREGQRECDVAAADVHDKGSSVVSFTRVFTDSGAADVGREVEEGMPGAPREKECGSPHGRSQSMATGLKSSDSVSNTAAGGGLPYYLAIQLNRFAYQRISQSYQKITDGVPLNEVIIVPVYTTGAEQRDPPQPSSGVHGFNKSTLTTSEVAGNCDLQHEDEGRYSSPVDRVSAVPADPVWVAYRLRAIVIHSGSTPNSGHYFTLARCLAATPVEVQPDNRNYSEEEVDHAVVASELATLRAYVEQLGSALTSSLQAEPDFPSGQRARQTTGAGDAASVEGSSSHNGAEVAGWPPQDRAPVPHTPPGTEAGFPSPVPSPAPTLPDAAVSVSGDRLYESWVMLNDSHVQPVGVDTMRSILHGSGGGVYSSMETPYIILYEKTPVAFQKTAAHPALSGNEEAADPYVLDATRSVALRLQRLWETPYPSVCNSGGASTGDPRAESVQFSPAVMQTFTARLKDETASSTANKPVSRKIKPYIPPFIVGNETRPLPQAAAALTSGETQGATSRAAFAEPPWVGTTNTGNVVPSEGSKAFHVDLSNDVPVVSSDRNVSRATASHRPRRLTSVTKYSQVLRTKRHSASRNHGGAGKHRKRGGSAHKGAVLSSSGSDVSSELDDG